ncbi:hypothetical protein D3C77_407710 [compost metagenome]
MVWQVIVHFQVGKVLHLTVETEAVGVTEAAITKNSNNMRLYILQPLLNISGIYVNNVSCYNM